MSESAMWYLEHDEKWGGLLSVKGVDRLQFLHAMATNDFEETAKGASEGQLMNRGISFPTAFVNGKGIVLEYAEAILLED